MKKYSHHHSVEIMGRAVKLKRQRKRQQQQLEQASLNTLQFPTNPYEEKRELDLAFNRIAFNLTDWLSDQWSTVPNFFDYFTCHEVRQVAEEALSLLFDTSTEKSSQDVSIEWAEHERFTIHLSFKPKLLSIETSILDKIDNKTFDLPGEFRLLSHNPQV